MNCVAVDVAVAVAECKRCIYSFAFDLNNYLQFVQLNNLYCLQTNVQYN